MKLREKTLLMMLFIGLITSFIIGTIIFVVGKRELEKESYKKLTAIRELKANQIENYFEQIFNQIISYSEDQMIVQATLDFKNGFDRISDELRYSQSDLQRIDSALITHYQEQFLNNLLYIDSVTNYFPVSKDDLNQNQKIWLETAGSEFKIHDSDNNFPKISPSQFVGDLSLEGSSTVSSLANNILKLFREQGALGEINYQSTSSSDGISSLIEGSEIEAIGLSHELNEEEIKSFENAKIRPLTFRIGTDALVVVVGKGNTFLDNLSYAELKAAFTGAEKWSDINPSWPHEDITRFIPREGTGSYNLFVDKVLGGNKEAFSNVPNKTVINDGEYMKEQMKSDPYSLAFFSYNYYDPESSLRQVDIDGFSLNKTNIIANKYTLTRPLYLATTETNLRSNRNLAILLNFFINSLDSEVGTVLSKKEYWPEQTTTRILQHHFLTNNDKGQGNSNLINLSEQSSYNKSHNLYHPIFKNYLDRFGYYDIFIIDLEGNVIYTVKKEVDFATNLIHGPYRETSLADLFNQTLNSTIHSDLKFADFAPYLPSSNAPASFISSPIFHENEHIGTLVFQLPIDKINEIMTDNYQWEKVGLGKSGETYLVGADFRMRNQSRFLIEDFDEYIQSLDEMNLPRDIKSKIRILHTTIGLQPVINPGTQAALKGRTGTEVFKDYRGIEVLSSFRPLNIDSIDWIIMSEIDKSEAFAFIPLLFRNFTNWSFILLILILLLSFYFSRSISRPVQQLGHQASEVANGNLEEPILIRQKDEIGQLAENFDRMRLSIKGLVQELQDVNQNLENRVEQRTEELSSANNQIKGILDSILDALIIINDRGIIVSCSPSTKTLFQYHEKELIGQNVKILMPSPHKEKHDGYLESYKNSGVRKILGIERELMGIRKDGSSFPVRLMVNEVKTASGKLFVGLLGDLTERKKNELRLKLQSTALKSASNGVVITDSEGIITWVNPAFTKLTGYKWDELVGKTPRVLKSGRHTEEFYNEIWSTVLRGDVWHGEIINKKSNGKLYYEEMTITPIRDEEDKIIQFVAIKNDISERKKAEDEIRRSEEFRRLLLNSTGEGIYGIDLDGNCTFANPSCLKLLGYDNQDELLGKNMHNLIHHTLPNGDPYIMQECQIYKAFNKGVDVHVDDEVFWRKDGTSFPVEYYSLPLRQDGEIVGSVLTFTDITERKRLEEILLNEKERMEKELNVAKEIQMSMLPLIFPAFPQRKEIDIYASLTPAREVGGDFYDFHFLDENHLYFVVGDVSGKGVPAALMMAVTKTLLKSRAANDRSTASILTHVNNEIAKENDACMFITIFIAILNTSTGDMVFSNAGHNPTFIINKDREIATLKDLHGPVIGALEDMTYTESITHISKDDIIFAYTDGITEAQNVKGEFYSESRLANLLIYGDYNDPRSLTGLVENSVENFQGKADQFDDITSLTLQYLEEVEPRFTSSLSVTIKNQLNQIPNVISQFEAFGEKNNLPFSLIHKFNIALDELLSNIITYGFNDDLEHEIDVHSEMHNNRLIFIIKDDGMPFNPFKNDPPDTMLSIEERGVGGLGIHLVKNLVDNYDYKRDTDRNVITLVKYNIIH